MRYVAGLAGLLNVHWQLPGYQPDFCAPGGALVFELRQSNRSKQYLVRVFYTAQTFDQLRSLTPLTLKNPPATMQLMVPGGSNSATNLDVNFGVFQKLMKNAIGQQYVENPWKEDPPGVLTGVSCPDRNPAVENQLDSEAGGERTETGVRVGPNALNFRFECFLGHEEYEGYTKCTKENHCQGSCMGKVFLCFLFFVFDQYFSGSKAHKGASPDRFSLCTFVLLSRIFLFFEQDFVYKLLFSQRSLR